MKKSKNLKRRIGAVLLSLVLALTMIVTPSTFTTKKVSADETEGTENQNLFTNWAIAIESAQSETSYFKEDETPDLKTAIFFTVLQYEIEPETNEKIDVDTFIDKVNSNFNFGESDKLTREKMEPFKDNEEANGWFAYDGETVTIPGGKASNGLTCVFIGEKEDNNSGVDTKYGVLFDKQFPTVAPQYVALDLKDDKIISYRKIKNVSADLVIYENEYDEESGQQIRTEYTIDNKTFLPYNSSYNVGYKLKVEDDNEIVTLNEQDLGEDALKIKMSSKDSKIVQVHNDNEDELSVTSYEDKGNTSLKYELEANGDSIFAGTQSCTVFGFKISDNNFYSMNFLPGETIELKAQADELDSENVSYKWNSKELNIDNVEGKNYQLKVPTDVKSGKISVTAFINGTKIATCSKEFNVKDCNFNIVASDRYTHKTHLGALKVNEGYYIELDGLEFDWDLGNGNRNDEKNRQTFYIIDFEFNGNHLTATEKEENLKNDDFSVSIGAGGGNPNRIVTFKKAGTLKIDAKAYRNGELLKAVSQTFTVEGDTPSNPTKPDPTPSNPAKPDPTPSNPTKPDSTPAPSNPTTTAANKTTTPAKVTVKKTTLKSAKNAKGKKLVVKWGKNTAGNGYQVQYSTSKKFANGNKTKTISKNKTTSLTIKGLKKKKTYYVRIRTYKKVAGKTYYSSWSSVKKAKINK